LIGALYRKNVNVADLARDKAADLRVNFSSWLSKPIATQLGVPFKQILCFESASRGEAPALVGDIFRALEPFALGPPYVTSIAIPFIAAGNQGYDIDEVAAALFDATWTRLHEGHPLKVIRIVDRNEKMISEVAQRFTEAEQETHRPINVSLHSIFGEAGEDFDLEKEEAYVSYCLPMPPDVFVSYSRVDQDAARVVVSELKKLGLSVFIDEEGLEIGVSWQQEIFDALENCRCVVAMYSPDFLSSPVCKDEFNAAMILRRRKGKDFIFPILVRATQLPAYMEMLNYFDCLVSDAQKLALSAAKLGGRLGSKFARDVPSNKLS
jgi:hypothetical protein